MKVKITVKMKDPWSVVTSWPRKPTVDQVLEFFANEVMAGKIDDLFVVDTE